MENQAIYKLDSCKFKPSIKCVKEFCPAWKEGMCAFDIGEIAVKKTYDLILEGIEKWKCLNNQEKIKAIDSLLERL